MKNLLYSLLFFWGSLPALFAQTYLEQKIQDGDTLFVGAKIPTVLVYTKRTFASDKEASDFYRLQRNIGIVYPYAMMAKEIYASIQHDLEQVDKRRKEKKYLREREERLKSQFEEQLKNLTESQGRILVQLINRETGNNCYELIKELKNPMAAAFWQLVAKKHGYNLKAPYRPEDNPDLELIVRALQSKE